MNPEAAIRQQRVVICHPKAAEFLADLQASFPQAEFAVGRDIGHALDLARECSAFICGGRDLSEDVARRLFTFPHLRWVQVASAGVDKLSSITIPPHIRLTRGGGIHRTAVAEHALALILALYRRLDEAVRNQTESCWATSRGEFETISGKNATVLGFGEIGRSLGAKLRALDARVTGISRHPAPAEGIAVRPATELREVLATTDILVSVLPGGPETRGMIGAEELALLPPRAIVINVGRGTSLDGDALVAAIRSGRLAGAGLDVTDPEPLPADHPLWRCPNVLISPHVAGRDRRQPEQLVRLIEANLSRFLAGEPLLFEVA